MKNFETIHEFGVYKDAINRIWIVLPEHLKTDFMKDRKTPLVAIFLKDYENKNFEYANWNPYSEQGLYQNSVHAAPQAGSEELVEFLYDHKDKCDYDGVEIGKEVVAESTRDYNYGIFRAKITKRSDEKWLHFDTRSKFDEGIYGYTEQEFLSLMKLLKVVEREILSEQEDN